MTDSPPQRRRYRSVRRQEQAEQTRAGVLVAARRLFEERGYEATTIAAVAEDAGVSVETVYGHFGGKRTLFGELFRRAVRGRDERPVADQRVPRALASMADQREQLRSFAADIVPRLERAAPLIAVLAGASRSDPELADLLQQLHDDRRRNLRVLVESLSASGPLLVGSQDALDTVWALTGPELHQMLRRAGGWSEGRYQAWLADSLARLLLP